MLAPVSSLTTASRRVSNRVVASVWTYLCHFELRSARYNLQQPVSGSNRNRAQALEPHSSGLFHLGVSSNSVTEFPRNSNDSAIWSRACGGMCVAQKVLGTESTWNLTSSASDIKIPSLPMRGRAWRITCGKSTQCATNGVSTEWLRMERIQFFLKLSFNVAFSNECASWLRLLCVRWQPQTVSCRQNVQPRLTFANRPKSWTAWSKEVPSARTKVWRLPMRLLPTLGHQRTLGWMTSLFHR